MMHAVMKKKMIMIWLLCLLCFPIVGTLSNMNQTKVRSHHRRFKTPQRLLQSSSSSSSSSFSTAIAKLTASDGRINDSFGNNNAVPISNHRIVVGADGYDSERGAAYLFGDPSDRLSGRSYSQLAILTANDGQIDDEFGNSVAIQGDIVVVGASYASIGGAVFVYRIFDENNIITISQLAKLTASDGKADDWFGWSVAINENTILVGAHHVDRNDSASVGSAYLFGNPSNDPNAPKWTQLQQLQPNDLAAGDYFGWSVALDENIAVIGTNDPYMNAAYVFAPVVSSLSSSSWTQMAKLTGSTGSWFGNSVAVTGNWIVVGAFQDDTNGYNAGAAFVFTKTSSSSWTQLLAADGAAGDFFGSSVVISKDGSSIVVGADGDDIGAGIQNSGAAYLFRLINMTTTTTSIMEWTQMGKFVARQ
jgi:hypothetical protein